MQYEHRPYRQGEVITEHLPALVRLTHVIYGLQAVCVFFGVTYLFAVIAVIINYIKYPNISGTWLEPHFRWQIRTFWFGLLWYIVGGLTLFMGIGWLIIIATYIWLIYRIIKGWIYLNDKRTVF